MPLLISKFNGGISSGSKIGLSGSFRFGCNLDIHSDPDVLKISPASTKDSDSVVDSLVKFSSCNTVNSSIYFLGTKLYKKASGVYSVINTYTTPQGMGWFNGTSRIVFAAGNTEYKLDPSNDSITNGRALNEASYHPVEAFLDKVFIGNGREIISTDGSGIDYDSETVGGGITLDYGYKARVFKNLGDWFFIGATSDNSSNARYFIWDGVSEKYNYAKTLKGEDGINSCEVSDDGSVIISAGKNGHLYQLTGLDTTLRNIKTIPRIEKDKTIEIYPQAMANYQGRVLLGLSDGTSLTAERGVYSWASHDENYPKILNMDYAISTSTTTGTGLQIGCLLSANTTDLYVSWKDGSNFGIDLINGTGVQATAKMESLIHDDGQPFRRKKYDQWKITLAKVLASGEVITLYYKADRATTGGDSNDGWITLGTLDFASDAAILEKSFRTIVKARELEVKASYANSGATAPETDSLLINFNYEPVIS